DDPPVGADPGNAAVADRLPAPVRDADTYGPAGFEVVPEDVGVAVRVAWNEIGCARGESRVSSMAAQKRPRLERGVADGLRKPARLGLRSVARDADPRCCAGEAIVHEDVDRVVGVARNEIAGA